MGKRRKSYVANLATWELEAIKLALSKFRMLNTPEEKERLKAVTAELKKRKRKKKSRK